MHHLERRQPDLPLFGLDDPPRIRFDGPDVTPSDTERLSSSLGRVYDLMRDGQFRRLDEIAEACQTSQAGASARLRDLRKPRFQRLFPTKAVNRRNLGGGLWEYQVQVR